MKKENYNFDSIADNELNATEWIGAMLRYFLKFGKIPFNSIYNQKQKRKNVRVGNWIKILVFLIGIVFLFIWFRGV
ncbi:hypothetical protein [Aureivirga marina]|uniref:hypothetical protein n=1 Tax=Aureivirga marina TaxID=1182451 RepID=UPI0018CB7082|nr:hypothetical protein [Aureivirga marina]